ncbi:MAG: tetratricopeptide repeat protein [Acidobacteria bacterium]|nr:tetratricopeptide repeat protein [Acidobacteriota bacterium]
MKRCPECGRDYDNSMMFCLDDGAELLYGPAKSEPGAIATGFPSVEPQTAILHSTAATGEAPTRAQIHTTEQTAVLPPGISETKKSFDKRLIFAPLALAVIALGGFFGYRYITPANQIESIAVMPFVNESGNADVEYLSDGMTETLIGSLSKLPNLIVKPSSSVFRYKGQKTDAKTIAQELNVHAVLNGRIVQRGDELTLSLELVDVQKDAVLWSERYVRRQSELVSLQSEIAKDVSSRLKTRLTGAEEEKIAKSYTADAEAYRDYLQGRYYWNKRDGVNLRKAIEQFEAAIDKDPKYALAYVGLADSYAVFQWWDDDFPVDSLSKARQFAKRAIEIDDSLGEAHASLAYVNLYSWNWAESEKEFLRAIELSPDYANAHRWYHEYLLTQGRVDDATKTLKKSYELEPLSVIVNYNLANHYCQDKLDPQSATEFAKRVVDLDPKFPGGPQLMACVYLGQGRNADALAEAKKAVELTNGKIRRIVSKLGAVYAETGQTENAKAIIIELEEAYAKQKTVGVQIAEVYAALGNKDKAFEWIEKDVESRGFELVLSIRRDEQFGSLKSDKRYAAILKRMGLPE